MNEFVLESPVAGQMPDVPLPVKLEAVVAINDYSHASRVMNIKKESIA